MKKYLLTILTFILVNLPVFADVIPYYVSNVSTEIRGLYQAPKNLKIYSQPNEKSDVVLLCNWDYKNFNCPNTSMSNHVTTSPRCSGAWKHSAFPMRLTNTLSGDLTTIHTPYLKSYPQGLIPVPRQPYLPAAATTTSSNTTADPRCQASALRSAWKG